MSRRAEKFPRIDTTAEYLYSSVMRNICLAALVVLLTLHAQDNDVDAAIQAAQTARNPETLEKRAAELEAQYKFDSAQKVLEAALALREQVDGDQSANYGLCLMKLGAIERKAGHGKQAAEHYARAVRLLPGRPETAPVFLYLGITSLNKKGSGQATETEYLERARSLDPSLNGPVMMWTALMHERQDQADQAEAAYKAALAIATPGSIEEFETRTLYGRFLKQHGRDAEADAIQPHAPVRNGQPGQHPVLVMSPNTATTAGVYRVGGGVSQPSVIYKVDPEYSEEARVAKYSATVLLQLVVGADGVPGNIKVVKQAGFGLDDCAVATVAKWRFKPGQKDGSPVAVAATVEINFRLL
jgi:TonB family protein